MRLFDQACIDKSLPIPVGRQLHGLLSYVIAFGLIPTGARLPSVRELAQSVGVAPMTVNEVYQELRATGLIEIRPGVGAYVNSEKKANPEQLALHADISLLIEKGAGVGIGPLELAAMLTSQAKFKISRELKIGFVGIFRPAVLDYASEIKELLENDAEVECYTISEIEESRRQLAACAACDVVLVPIHREHEIRKMMPEANVTGLRFIPSQATRSALANLDPRTPVVSISYFEEHVASLKHAIREFAPHVADVKATWVGAADLESSLQDRTVAIYATGAEHITTRLSTNVSHFEFRHSPDPVAVNLALGSLARLRLRGAGPAVTSEVQRISEFTTNKVAAPQKPVQLRRKTKTTQTLRVG